MLSPIEDEGTEEGGEGSCPIRQPCIRCGPANTRPAARY